MTPAATRPLAFLGSPSASLLQALSEVAHEALPGAAKPLLFGPEARATIANGAPCVALVDVDDPAAEDEAIALRRDPAHATTPLIGVAASADEVAFSTSYGFGGDDVVPVREMRKLVPRVRVLQSTSTSMVAPQRRGVAIVASDDRKRRVTVGRLLHAAGYSIEFAADAAEASSVAQKSAAKLVVIDSGIDAAATLTQIKRARLTGLVANWVLVVPPRSIAQLAPLVDPLPYVALGDAFAPPENVLFVANELARGGGNEGRGSARLLFGATVHFRIAGREEDDIGFTYNVSQTGLYVRTLVAPPAKSTVWVELQPPRSDRRVRLEGVVQWRRPFGPNDQATVPTGFGFEITDGSRADRERYAEGYKALYASTFGS
jgi:DNA-binding response OmpR family regulator